MRLWPFNRKAPDSHEWNSSQPASRLSFRRAYAGRVRFLNGILASAATDAEAFIAIAPRASVKDYVDHIDSIAQRMKMRELHIVPLSKQALDILSGLRPLTGRGRHVFPSLRTAERPMAENTINAAASPWLRQ